jgi:ABC-2 type transport system ATP-binding protein
VLEVRAIRKRFGDVVALDGVSLAVGAGELVGFLGPNGAGKTTTMRAIMQLVTLDGGTITWNGAPISADDRRRFGYMPAERGMYPKMRVREQLVYYARLGGMSRAAAQASADRWIERVGLTHRAGDDVQDLSSGNQQRVQLALALVNEPELLVLDEPFSGLDPIAAENLKQILVDQVAAGTALLFSSHQLDLVADVSRQVVIVDRGRVVLEGDVRDIRARSSYRYADVDFAAPVAWRPQLAGVEVASTDTTRIRLRVDPAVDPAVLLADASAVGTVASFSFAPPDLSEVFFAAVGRPPEAEGVEA